MADQQRERPGPPLVVEHGAATAEEARGIPEPDGAPALPSYAEAVLDVVDQIPEGRVLAYGDVAELVGEGGPRQVGSVMSRYGSATSWWRVLRANGDPPRCHEGEALQRYREEQTPLVGGSLSGSRVDMRRARWDGGVGGP